MAIDFRLIARLDVEEIAQFLEQSDPRLAFRFYEAVQEAAELAERFPEIGRSVESRNPALRGARYLILRRFRNHVLYYKPTDVGIMVMRVVHGSRNLEQLE